MLVELLIRHEDISADLDTLYGGIGQWAQTDGLEHTKCTELPRILFDYFGRSSVVVYRFSCGSLYSQIQ